MALWNLLLNWKGLVHHGGVGRIWALAIIVVGLLLLTTFVLALALLMVFLIPDNIQMLMDTINAYLSSREF